MALFTTLLVNGRVSGKDHLPSEQEEYFKKKEEELVKAQLGINKKWEKLWSNLTAESDRDDMADDIVLEQIKLGQAWDKLAKKEKKALEEWNKMNMKQKLAGLIEVFKQQNASKEIWGDHAPVSQSVMANVTVHIDTLNSMVGIYTDEVDGKGLPILQWEMNTQSGHITETSRSMDGQVNVVEKDPYFASHRAYDTDLKSSKDSIIDISDEMQDVEKQRDIAFKIMLFFISFVIGAFGLLYWIFTQIEAKRQEDIVKEGIKNQRFVTPQDVQQRSFADFIVDQLDNESMVVNPYARHVESAAEDQTERRASSR